MIPAPHDVYDEEDPRITPEQWRNPRVVVIDWTHDGQLSFGELSNEGYVMDTTLTGAVLDPMERGARMGRKCSLYTIDGIDYVCLVGAKP